MWVRENERGIQNTFRGFAKLMLRRSFKESTPRTREEKLKRALRRRIKK